MKNKKLKILFLDIFTDDKKFRKEIEKKVYKGGTLSNHVRKVFGLDKNQWLTLDASKDALLDEFLNVDAMVISGSSKNPVKGQEKKWMRNTYKFIRKAIKKEGAKPGKVSASAPVLKYFWKMDGSIFSSE